MDFFLITPLQRILEWRRFRARLAAFDDYQQLCETSQFWGNVPIQTYAVDWDKAEAWPSAWQLIHEGNFDTNVIAYLMEQTLILGGWDASRLKLMYVKNDKVQDEMMLLLVDEKWVLNYSHKEVFDFTKIKNDCRCFITYQMRDGKRVQID